MDKKIYIFRHGETAYNKKQIMQGRSINISLNKDGIEQTTNFFEFYKNIPFELIVTSELKRSIESAKGFIDLNIPHNIDERITEISWGENEGKPIDDKVIDRFNIMVEEWSKGNLEYSIPGGESGASLKNRMIDFIRFIKSRPEKTILVCTHGRALKMLITQFLNKPINEMEEFHHHNTGLYLIEQKADNFNLLMENDISHLNK